MPVLMDREVQVVREINGEQFYNANLPNALRAAQNYAGKKGYVASMPQLLHGRVIANPDNEIWQNWFTANSEEDVGKSAQGKNVVIEVHGGGIFGSPERIEGAYKEGLEPVRSGKLKDNEIKDLLSGKLPDGTELPVYSFSDFRKGIPNLPMQYAVVMDLDTARKTKSDYQDIDGLYETPLVIVRSGGIQEASQYLNRAKDVHSNKKLGNWHPFNSKNFDPEQSQGRLLFLGNYGYNVLSGIYGLGDYGRFVGVEAAEPQAARENLVLSYSAQDIQNAITELKALSAVVKPEAVQNLEALLRQLS